MAYFENIFTLTIEGKKKFMQTCFENSHLNKNYYKSYLDSNLYFCCLKASNSTLIAGTTKRVQNGYNKNSILVHRKIPDRILYLI